MLRLTIAKQRTKTLHQQTIKANYSFIHVTFKFVEVLGQSQSLRFEDHQSFCLGPSLRRRYERDCSLLGCLWFFGRETPHLLWIGTARCEWRIGGAFLFVIRSIANRVFGIRHLILRQRLLDDVNLGLLFYVEVRLVLWSFSVCRWRKVDSWFPSLILFSLPLAFLGLIRSKVYSVFAFCFTTACSTILSFLSLLEIILSSHLLWFQPLSMKFILPFHFVLIAGDEVVFLLLLLLSLARIRPNIS